MNSNIGRHHKTVVYFMLHTLQFPGFPLFLFGDLLYVFVIDVVLAHKTVNSSVQQVYS